MIEPWLLLIVSIQSELARRHVPCSDEGVDLFELTIGWEHAGQSIKKTNSTAAKQQETYRMLKRMIRPRSSWPVTPLGHIECFTGLALGLPHIRTTQKTKFLAKGDVPIFLKKICIKKVQQIKIMGRRIFGLLNQKQ